LRVGFKAPPRGVQGRNSTGPALSNGVYYKILWQMLIHKDSGQSDEKGS
jgi:hypothetical protein